MKVSAAFDSGNIQVLDASDPSNIRLAIKEDPGQERFYQWFNFRVSGIEGVPLTLHIENAAGAAYPKGWEDYNACASYNREDWFRVETAFDGKVLTIQHTAAVDTVQFAYFPPYSRERHLDLIAACQNNPICRHRVIGETLDGADMDLLTIGLGHSGNLSLWAIARQHPGETMAEWWMEGLLERLLDPDDPIARRILSRADFHVIPNMNPDGSRRGHLRTNAKGINLNREWDKESLENGPEVYHTLQAMAEAGADFCIDVHGDESLPYNFIAGADSIPSATAEQIAAREKFEAAYEVANPDFQREQGYPKAPPGKANMSMCSAQVAERFGALSMTLEMPFKDNANAPDPYSGWSIPRCRKLGASALDALAAVLDDLGNPG